MSHAWVVIPTYNEAENLEAIVDAIRAEFDGSILVVDDNSPDGTGQIADRLADEHADVHVLHRPAKDGLAAAYVAGFRIALAAGAEYVFTMDADFSHDPADLPRLLEAAEAGADVVLGSRYVEGGGVDGWSRGRQIISRAGGFYARTVLGSQIRDITAGFKCFRAEALGAIGLDLAATGYAFNVETAFRAARAGLRVEEVPIIFRERNAGRSKMSPAIAAEAIWRIPEMRLAARRRAVHAPHAPALPVSGD
jgi:dolichol-phosphate mannosyltransferase